MKEPSVKAQYRRGVGVMLINQDGLVFVGRRTDSGPNAWQMPQGGIDPGESPDRTALRELHEETGIPKNKVEIITETKEWLRYDFPPDLIKQIWEGKYQGQEQKWFLMRFVGTENDINIATEHPEFNAWKWVTLKEVPFLIVPFKKELYDHVCSLFAPFFPIP